MIKKITLLLLLVSMMIPMTLSAQEVRVWDFEDEAQLSDWTLVDLDGDGKNWNYFSNAGLDYGRATTHSGDGIMMSASYDYEEFSPLSPDNWLISPEVTLGGTLSLWACGQDPTYCNEIFAVYVCVDDMTNVEGSVEVGGYHFLRVGSDVTATNTMTEYAFGLSDYQGQTGRFAIRHYKTKDEFILNIDDVKLDINTEYIPDPTTPTNLEVVQAATTADVTWDGAEGDKWNLRYRVINPNEKINLLWDLTIDNYESQAAEWTIEDRDGDGYNWGLAYSDFDSNEYGDLEDVCFTSSSWINGTGPLTPDNWLMTPELPLGGTFTFSAKNGDDDNKDDLDVYVITDEGTVQIGKDITPSSEEWTEYSFNTGKYDGQVGKIAIVHNCEDKYYVYVDYISYYKEGAEPAEWIEVNDLTTTSHMLTDLTSETKYEVQVQAYINEKESEWSESIIFITNELNDFTENGSGTEADPYIITTVKQMETLATKMNTTQSNQDPEHFAGVYFALGNDLVYSGENNFTTIATGGGVKHYFAGTFDGRGYSISGINLNTTDGRQGIFGVVRNGGTVKNLTLKSSTITGGDATGGIVGRLMAGCLVENCHVENDVTITGRNYAGGVVGYNLGGTIRACSSAANVSGSNYLGGITGACDPGSTVENCFFYGGGITGTNVGAIVGLEALPINTTPNYNYLGNLYYTTANIKGVNGSDKDGAERGYKITSGTEGLTFKYNDGSLIRYDDVITKIGDGLHYQGVYYGKAGGSVNIVASVPSGTITKLETTAGTLTGSLNTYRLTFAEDDATITATIADEPIDVTLYDNGDEAAGNASVITDKDKKLANVTLSGRTFFKDGYWNTLCLPFDFVIEDSPLEGATIMVLDGAKSSYDNTTGTLKLYFTDYTEPVFTAGTTCIVKWDVASPSEASEVENPVFNGVIIKDAEPVATSSSDNAVTFTGTYGFRSFTEDYHSILFMDGGNTLNWPKKDASIGACRAYFQLADGITAGSVNNARLFFGSDDTQGIISIDNGQLTIDNETGSWYTVNGVKVEKPKRKGLYIQNGRKVVMK